MAVSALNAADVARLSAAIVAALGAGPVEETISIPEGDGGLLAELCRMVRVTGTSVVGGRIEVRFRSRPEDRERVARLLALADAAGAGAAPVSGGRRSAS